MVNLHDYFFFKLLTFLNKYSIGYDEGRREALVKGIQGFHYLILFTWIYRKINFPSAIFILIGLAILILNFFYFSEKKVKLLMDRYQNIDKWKKQIADIHLLVSLLVLYIVFYIERNCIF